MFRLLIKPVSQLLSTTTTRSCCSLTMLNDKKKQKQLQIHLENVARDSNHKSNPIASTILKLQSEVHDIISFSKESKEDAELQQLAQNDLNSLNEQINRLSSQFLSEMISRPQIFETCDEILLELSAGVGGQEAMLFTGQLFELYLNYAQFKRWNVYTVNTEHTEMGGLRHGQMIISSPRVYAHLHQEAGVHRVQRVPRTEKSGRVHTSTSSVSISPSFPSTSLLELELKESDLKIETKRASGAGGQHVNTTESAVRITHLPSGIQVDCQTQRSQIQNRHMALKILKNRLYQFELEFRYKTDRSIKKSQIGLSERSDKIRTFNFLQDRITDHRFGLNYFNIKSFLEGGVDFEKFLIELKQKEFEYNVQEFISNKI